MGVGEERIRNWFLFRGLVPLVPPARAYSFYLLSGPRTLAHRTLSRLVGWIEAGGTLRLASGLARPALLESTPAGFEPSGEDKIYRQRSSSSNTDREGSARVA